MKKFKFVILVACIAMIGIGTHRGEVSVVLNKGINICLECIGIG